MPDDDTLCQACGRVLEIGDYPFCPHGSIWSAHAQRFSPIVVHVSQAGEYRFPASVDAPIPAGYRKVEIRTIQEADRISREVNAREDSTLRAVQAQSDTSRSLTRARNRAFMDSIRHKLSPAGREYLDRAREYVAQKDRARENSRPRSTNFFIDVFAHDASNRERHADERTGWKGRKG
jgi:hypothetical protein